MSSPPKKVRKNVGGGGSGASGSGSTNAGGAASGSANDSVVSQAQADAEPIANENNDIEMDDDLDPAEMYEDEEGRRLLLKSNQNRLIYGNFNNIWPVQVVIMSVTFIFRHPLNRIARVNRRAHD